MKTTFNLNDSLLRKAKKRAAERGVTLTSLVEDALRDALTSRAKREPYKLELPVWDDPEPLPFDVADRRAMYEWFDRHP